MVSLFTNSASVSLRASSSCTGGASVSCTRGAYPSYTGGASVSYTGGSSPSCTGRASASCTGEIFFFPLHLNMNEFVRITVIGVERMTGKIQVVIMRSESSLILSKSGCFQSIFSTTWYIENPISIEMVPLGSHPMAMKNESFNLTHLQSMKEKAAENQINLVNKKIANPIPNIPTVICLSSIDAPADPNKIGNNVDYQSHRKKGVGFLFFQMQFEIYPKIRTPG
jgi:hypothetical protein